MERRTVTPGQTVTVVLPWSEVCMSMRVAGQRRRVTITRNGAQLLNDDGTPFSFPILHGEAGLHVQSYRPLVLSAECEIEPIVAHRWYARDGYDECIRCGLTCEVTESRPIDDQPYPLNCGSESVCPVLGEDGRTQAHTLIGAPGGLECHYCGKHYA